MYPSLMLASMISCCCDVALVGRCYGTLLCCYALCWCGFGSWTCCRTSTWPRCTVVSSCCCFIVIVLCIRVYTSCDCCCWTSPAMFLHVLADRPDPEQALHCMYVTCMWQAATECSPLLLVKRGRATYVAECTCMHACSCFAWSLFALCAQPVWFTNHGGVSRHMYLSGQYV